LIGDYAEEGMNHGRKYFKKQQKIKGHEDISVYLYYWDQRDGADFGGWWFGDQIGGSQVWARSNSHGAMPPRIGWKCPWDAPKAEPGVLFVDPFTGGGATAAAAATAAAGAQKGATIPPPNKAGGGSTVKPPVSADPAAIAEKVTKLTEQVAEAEKASKEAVDKAKEAAASKEPSEEALKEVTEALAAQQKALTELQTGLTQDMNLARKAGPPAMSSVTEMSKLSPKVRTAQASVTTELNKARAHLNKLTAATKAAEAKEKQAKQEENDSKELDEFLPGLKETVEAVDTAVTSVVNMATPLLSEPPEEDTDAFKAAMDEVETGTNGAVEKLTEARKEINAKLQGARSYAPETRKRALAECSVMQQKLTEATAKITPYKTFRKDFKARVEAKKQLTEITDSLGNVELEVEKASMVTAIAEKGAMSDEEVTSAEEIIAPLQKDLTNTLRVVETKLRAASGAMKDELALVRDRGMQSKKKLEQIVVVLRKQKDVKAVKQMIAMAGEKADACDASLTKCQEAEMPFLKGLEILPQEESSKAIADSEAASAKSDQAIAQARTFMKAKIGESKRFAADQSKQVTEEMNQLLVRVEAAAKKLQAFKKETMERKIASLLAEVVDSITAAEKKVAVVVEAAKLFSSDSLDKVTTESIKEAAEKVSSVEQEASDAVLAAKKLIAVKQKEAKGGDAAAAIAKLSARLGATQQDLAKQIKAAATGDKLIKGKEIIAEAEAKVEAAEGEAKKVEEIAGPLGEEGAKELAEDKIEELGTQVVTAQKVIKGSTSTVESHIASAVPVVKAALQKLVERAKKCTERVNAVLSNCKGQKQQMLSKAYVKEGDKLTSELETAIQKVNDVELPFLKGIEILPLQEATETIGQSEALVSSVQTLISDVRTFIASKNLEVKRFDAAVSKPVVEEFLKQTERINASAAKLSQFKRDTDNRKKTAQVQEAGENITAVAAEVKKLVEAVEPFMAESMTEDEASTLCEQLTGQAKEVQAKMDETRNFLAARQKDAKGSASFTEPLQKLQEKLSESMVELAKAKKVLSDHEQKYASKKLLAESQVFLDKMDAEIEKAKTTCGPLLEQGGEEFLVGNSVQTLSSVLRDTMAKKELTEDQVFAEANGGKTSGKIAQDTFIAYLEKLPATTEREELNFSTERRAAMFKQMDVDKDELISLEDFKEIFKRQYICKQGITLTDVFEIGKSKTKGKVEPNTVLEALGNPAKDEAGMTRLECKVVSTGKTGFVTMLGNQGTAYLQAITPFTVFAETMDKAIGEALKGITAASNHLKVKTLELAKAGPKTPLSEARGELAKLRPKVTTAQSNLDAFKKKVIQAKTEYFKKEEAERNAHIEARERKEADAILEVAVAKVDAMEACAKELEEATKTLTALQGPELDAFECPATAFENAEKLRDALTDSVKETRASVKEQQGKVTKAVKGPLLEAKKELAKMDQKAGAIERKCKSTMEAMVTACSNIVDSRCAEAAAAFREEVARRNITPDELFQQLVPPGDEKIPEAAFCRAVELLDGISFQPEHVKLLARHVEVGGIGRRAFLALIQQYYVVVRSIAITDDFEINKAKTIRKADNSEVIEVLEGPKTDDGKGLTRVKGKSLIDGQQGWLTVSGNQGTPFLQEMEKPYYACNEEVVLHPEFSIEDGDAIRTLQKDEVLELLEGPRKEVFTAAKRVRGKAITDNVIGWFTATDCKGNVLAEPDGQYYSCITSVAMTDEQDIKNCNVMRKLNEGEVFTVLEGPVDDKVAGITRVKGKAMKDEAEGWITIKGNAGTVYAQASSKHYTVKEDVPLHKVFASTDATVIRVLEKGEAMHALEGPKDETIPPAVRVKGRAQSDGAVGWITLKGENMRPWSPF